MRSQLETAGVILNAKKCKFCQSSIQFLGHVMDQKGVCPNQEKVLAVLQLKAPTKATELWRFMRRVNQLGKFFPNLAGYYHPTPPRTAEHQEIIGLGPRTGSAIQSGQEGVDSTYNTDTLRPAAPTKISADASSYGLGQGQCCCSR